MHLPGCERFTVDGAVGMCNGRARRSRAPPALRVAPGGRHVGPARHKVVGLTLPAGPVRFLTASRVGWLENDLLEQMLVGSETDLEPIAGGELVLVRPFVLLPRGPHALLEGSKCSAGGQQLLCGRAASALLEGSNCSAGGQQVLCWRAASALETCKQAWRLRLPPVPRL